MEFHEKLLELRNKMGLTQEDLARELHVSRTAVSKWETGRGFPNIDTLKDISKLFSVTVDDLLSGDKILDIAQESEKQTRVHFQDVVFGLLDCCALLFLLLPLYRQSVTGGVQSVFLLADTGMALYLKCCYFAVIIGMLIFGVLILALQNLQHPFWLRTKYKISLTLNISGVALFMISLQPYAALLLFVFLIIKFFVLPKME